MKQRGQKRSDLGDYIQSRVIISRNMRWGHSTDLWSASFRACRWN